MKELVIIAGANGSGKSTLSSQINFEGPFLNADNYAKNLSDTDKEFRERKAVVMVAKEVHRCIKRGLSFAFETVFSTNEMPTFIESAKASGYQIILHYIGTENVEINIARVARRVSEGGHDVPVQKIVERYKKSMGMLPALLSFADDSIVYDNSGDKIYAFLVKESGQTKILSSPPNWVKSLLHLF